jgi:hypothetical protein
VPSLEVLLLQLLHLVLLEALDFLGLHAFAFGEDFDAFLEAIYEHFVFEVLPQEEEGGHLQVLVPKLLIVLADFFEVVL